MDQWASKPSTNNRGLAGLIFFFPMLIDVTHTHTKQSPQHGSACTSLLTRVGLPSLFLYSRVGEVTPHYFLSSQI